MVKKIIGAILEALSRLVPKPALATCPVPVNRKQ